MALIVSYQTPAGPRYGLVVDDAIHTWQGDPFTSTDYTPGPPLPDADQVRLAPPVRPSKIVCIGRNYAAHAAEHHAAVPDEPMIFLKPPSAVIGHEDTIQFYASDGRVEHEAELAVIIGRRAYAWHASRPGLRAGIYVRRTTLARAIINRKTVNGAARKGWIRSARWVPVSIPTWTRAMWACAPW